MRKMFVAALAAAVLGLGLGPAGAQALNDSANLKVMKAKSNLLKLQQEEKKHPPAAGVQQGKDQSGCGHVDIGNVDRQKGVTGGEVTVVITGDVINTGNKCK